MFRTLNRYLTLILGLLTVALPVQAALLPDCSPVPTPGKATCGAQHLLQLLINIYNYLLGFSGMIALLVIVIAGVRMLLYWMNEKPEQELQAAKYTMSRGIVGLVIIICAYLLVNTVIALIGGGGIQSILDKASNGLN